MSLMRLFRTACHLRPVQIWYRLWFRLNRPRIDNSAVPPRRLCKSEFVSPLARPRSMHGPARFSFLNRVRDVEGQHDWNDPCHPRLWLYHLHYFDDLTAVDACERSDWHQALVERWVRENSPGHGAGWEPYPTSRRMANWIKWHLVHGELSEEAIGSLATQARWLERRLEYHLLGNHLLANAKALAFAGLFFEGREGERWYRSGMRILEREVQEQILDDGGHFERAPMYHHLVFEDLLDLVNLCRAYNVSVPEWLIAPLSKMFRWADGMLHPDGDIAFFNDAAFGMAPGFSGLVDYAGRLGVKISGWHEGSGLLKVSGYARLEGGDYTALVDVAPVGPDYLPGHAHADTLSLELSASRRRLLVNSGTSEYEPGPERERQRGTAAHNTVRVDRTDSSEMWAAFRVGRRARVHNVRFDPGVPLVSAGHDGYRHLPGRPSHYREVRIVEGVVEVTDRVEGRGTHQIEAFWHFHPEVIVEAVDRRGERFRLHVQDEGRHSAHELTIEGPGRIELEQNSCWYPEFGKSVANARLVFRAMEQLPLRILTTIRPASG